MTKKLAPLAFAVVGIFIGWACGDAVLDMDAGADGGGGHITTIDVTCDQYREQLYGPEEEPLAFHQTWYSEIDVNVPEGVLVDGESCTWNTSMFFLNNDVSPKPACSRISPERISYGDGKLIVICGGTHGVSSRTRLEMPDFESAKITVRQM